MRTADFDISEDLLILTEFSDQSFIELSEQIDLIESLIEDRTLYVEAMKDSNVYELKAFGNQYKKTFRTTGRINSAMDSITNVGGNIEFTKWEVTLTLVEGIAKTIEKVWNKILSVPTYINKITKAIVKLPNQVMSKIKGNINLYLTANDIEIFYSNTVYKEGIFQRLEYLFDIADTMSKGDMWGRSFGSGRKRMDENNKPQNDVKLSRKFMKECSKLHNIEFIQQNIDMSKKENQHVYFGDAKIIKFRDLNKQEFQGTYYDGLIKIFGDLKSYKNSYKTLQDMMHNKMKVSSKQFETMRGDERAVITETIKEIGFITNFLAKLIKYVFADLKEIENAIRTISSKIDIHQDTTRSTVNHPTNTLNT